MAKNQDQSLVVEISPRRLQTKEDKLAAVHERAMRRFNAVYSTSYDVRLECLASRRFAYIPGSQWEGALGEQFANKPRFEVNLVQEKIERIKNEYRRNRISVDFRPDDRDTEQENADLLDGLYRADEQRSGAQEAYDNAFDEAVAGGMGAFRLRAVYEDDESEDDDRQRICIEPIFDADCSVWFDQNAKRLDKADAEWCVVLESVATPDYAEENGESVAVMSGDYARKVANKGTASIPNGAHLTEFDWYSPDVCYVGEYYEIEEKRDWVITYQLVGTDTEEKYRLSEMDDDDADEMLNRGFIEIKRKRIKTRKVHKYVIDGARVTEDCGYIAGKNIPIVPVYGKRQFIDNKERISGDVLVKKDSQRLYNMQVSKVAEFSAMSGRRKPIVSPEQMLGHAETWAEDNVKDYPYLMLNAVTNKAGDLVQPAAPAAYVEPPNIPEPTAALIALTKQDIANLTGAEAQSQSVGNVAQGTLRMMQDDRDTSNFGYMDNMAVAMRRAGQIWLSMAKELHDDEKDMQVVAEDGATSFVRLMEPIADGGGKTKYRNNISDGKFEVTVDVGPSFRSRRDAAVQNLTTLASVTDDPATRQVITGIVINNMDGEGLSDLKKFNRRKLIALGVIQPNDREKEEMAKEAQQPKQPDPQTVYLMAAAENERAKAQKAQADTVESLANAEKSRAETVKTLAEADSEKLDGAVKAAQTITGMVAERTQQGAPPQQIG